MGLYLRQLLWVAVQWGNYLLHIILTLWARGLPLKPPLYNHGRNHMTTEKKTTPSKKELLRDIETLDKNKVLDSTSF